MMNKKQKKMNKKAITQLKAYFLIINVIVAIVAFSWMVSGLKDNPQKGEAVMELNGPAPTTYRQYDGSQWVKITKEQYEAIESLPESFPVVKVDGAPPKLGVSGSGPVEVAQTPPIKPPELVGEVIKPVSGMATDGTYHFGDGTMTKNFKLGPNNEVLGIVDKKSFPTEGLESSLVNTKTGQYLDGYKYHETGISVDNPGFFTGDFKTGEGWLSADGKTFIGKDGSKYTNTAKSGDAKWKADSKTKTSSLAENAALKGLMEVGGMFALGYMIGGIIGDNADVALGAAFAAATFISQSAAGTYSKTFLEGPANFAGELGATLDKMFLGPGSGAVIIGAIIFVLLYEKTSTEKVTFDCLPFQPPVGGDDCELCNDMDECSEYVCKSLGQACELLNKGTGDEACAWVNPHDVTSPRIEFTKVTEGHTYKPDTSIRPPATGVEINQRSDECVEAFTALEFTISTDEPSQCKIDYNITRDFSSMKYFVGQTNLFSYNHTEEMSLPSPSSINALSPEIQNDGEYTLFIRCQDANGNFNQDPYSVRFCVKKGPDTTPPRIVDLSIPSNSPINYNNTDINLEVYVNEPANCKWSREDRDFAQMETEMNCDTNVWEMNNHQVYTCRTTLTGIKDRQDNEYYFKCKDQPWADEADRNVNTQSYLYNIIGTQPLNIINIKPANETIKGSTDTLEVNLEVETDNGYKDGESYCLYSTTGDEDSYIQFLETGGNKHTQRQDLVTGDYTYYIKCVDLGGNADYKSTSFSVETDRSSPIVVRAYKESGELKIITNEEADCSYSHTDCNFEIVDGIKMSSFDDESHSTEWLITKNYYIRCADEYNNQPDPNTCSVTIRPYKFVDKSNVVEL